MHWRKRIEAGLITLAAMVSPLAAAADERMVESFRLSDTRALVTACSLPADHELHARANAFCLGYMSGAMQFYDAAVRSPQVAPFVCAPDDLSRASLRNVFLEWAKANPGKLSEPAIDGLVRAAVAKFPCKQ